MKLSNQDFQQIWSWDIIRQMKPKNALLMLTSHLSMGVGALVNLAHRWATLRPILWGLCVQKSCEPV